MIKKSIQAKLVKATLNTIRESSGKIYVDETNLQRLHNPWPDEIASKHLTACLRGHSNIYTIVLVSVNGCLDYCNELIQNFSEGESQYESIKETIKYLTNIRDMGFIYINIDGQHRVDSYRRYLLSSFALRQSVINVIETDKGHFSEDFKGKLFKELSDVSQNEVLETPLTLVVINRATLNDLVDITIYTNIGEPWNKHEMRIIVPSFFNRFVHEFMNNNSLLTAMFNHTKKMDGDYSLVKKGDSLMICEWFAYYYNIKEGNIYSWPKNDILDKMCSIEGLPKYSKARLADAKSTISSVIELLNCGGKTKHERSLLDNCFIFMAIIYNSSHPLNPYSKRVKINDFKKMYDWFVKTEAALRMEDYYVMVNGKPVIEPITGKKITNSESFKRKCGAKKIDDIQLRSEKMISKFAESYDKLFADGVVTLIDTKNYTKQEKLEAAIASGWIDADGESFTFEELMSSESIIEGDHDSLARAKGGETSSENLKLRRKKANIRKSDKQISN